MKKGFTLIEAIVALAIFSVTIIVIASLYVYNASLYRIESAAGNIKMQKTIFIKTFRETAENAGEIVLQMEVGGVQFTSSSSTIIFKLPALDEDKNIISGAYDYAVFYKSGPDIFMATQADAASARKNLIKKISDKAGSLNFLYNNESPYLSDYVSADGYMVSGIYEENFSSAAHLRNKQ